MVITVTQLSREKMDAMYRLQRANYRSEVKLPKDPNKSIFKLKQKK